ncbi:type VI secretion system baseplate subunit TssG [Cupriavidus sp. 2SB]|uniref:type VI secretion system baseplate subunit TssG n=1 Tax=Cupriavidus sp. 2SB TaxID=2502199 RepID=UPI0010F973F8|nr:type VI secretion system baseplate subunit TssG [Cupriavidus sp. 2SB]
MYQIHDPIAPPAARTTKRSQCYADQPAWKLSFLGLLRGLSAQHPELPPVGFAPRPQAEPYRIGQTASLIFAPREIAKIEVGGERMRIQLFGLGILGPNGALPIHMTEIVRERTEAHRDGTTAAFLDVFHHRALTQFYRAWAGSQSAAGLDRADEEVFSRYIGWLAGADPDEIARSPLPPHARLAASAHHVRESRCPDGIVAALSQFFDVRVRLEEYVLHWIALDPGEHSYLGRPGVAGLLGQGALLGETVPDRQHKFRLVIGPLALQEYLTFTPNGRDLPVLVEWVRSFIGFEFEWEVELQVQPESAPAAVLGAEEQLGWSTWLGQPDTHRAVTGMVFQPEQYMTR